MNHLWLQNIVDSIAERGRELLGLDNSGRQQQDLVGLCQQLLAGEGEASGIALSQEILTRYQAMTMENKRAFFQMLAQVFEPDMDQILTSVSQYQASRSADDLIALNAAVESPRQELFRRLNMAPNGTANLVAVRADLNKLIKDNPALRAVEADLKHLLTSWFNRGFLQLQNIDWTSPAHVLEKLINYESVHEIQGWDDLRRRLMKDRRCFAFFHPAMPDEPLIFIEVAFVQGLADDIGPLIDPDAPELDPKKADTAIFYSINNTQAGLRGISFGNFLIKQVLTELAMEFPWIKTSSTLSPLPGFASWLSRWLEGESQHPNSRVFDEILQRHAQSLKDIAAQAGLDSTLTGKKLLQTLLGKIAEIDNAELATILTRFALAYLTTPDSDGRLPDPVAMFHLANGARLERINPNANKTPRGIASSYGVMVNYLYDLHDVETNHEAFVTKGEIRTSDMLQKERKQLVN